MTGDRLYLDHAATSWPKAPGVIDAMSAYLQELGSSAGRGNYASANLAAASVSQLRTRLARRIGASSPDCITFHSGCTAALNAAIHGLVGPQAVADPDGHLHSAPAVVGLHDQVLATAAEHNAVLRPLVRATQSVGARLDIVDCDENGRAMIEQLVESISERTRLIAITHASNVTGTLQPIRELSEVIAKHNRSRPPDQAIILLCDAAQTFGYLAVNVEQLGVDILAAPAHKGCGGPPGIGMLYLRPHLHDRIVPYMQGGTGQDGGSITMPETMPEKLEPGTLNMPAIAGWNAALDWLDREESRCIDSIQSELPAHLFELSSRLHQRLRKIPNLKVLGQPGSLPIASVHFGPSLSPTEAASILDLEFGVEVRAGYHCAAKLHGCLGTEPEGTLRISAGFHTTLEEIDRACDAIAELSESITAIS